MNLVIVTWWNRWRTRMKWAERKRRIERWWRFRLRERITLAGLGYVLATGLTAAAAFVSANNLLFLLVAAQLAALLVSVFISRLGLAGLELDIELPDHISARQPAPVRLTLKNDKSWMPSFSVHLTGVEESVFTTALYFPVVPASGTVQTSVEVTFARRGYHSEDSFLFHSRFPFGFAERRAHVTMKHEVLVYPALEPQPGFTQLIADLTGEAQARQRGRSHDFYRIRPYEPNESARHVDWRRTAHTGSLQVREFSRDQEPLIEVLLDLEVPNGQEDWFERAVECSSYLVWHALERGARVRFRTQDFEVRAPVEGDVYVILKYLALVEPRRKAVPLLRGVTSLDEPESAAILFSASPARLAGGGLDGVHVRGPGDSLFAGR
ncbi:MAG: DUF58 domain-containing protein [Bryobacter sp.]|nr:DUF58 domain-containing protein [Bryobacter sp.]